MDWVVRKGRGIGRRDEERRENTGVWKRMEGDLHKGNKAAEQGSARLGSRLGGIVREHRRSAGTRAHVGVAELLLSGCAEDLSGRLIDWKRRGLREGSTLRTRTADEEGRS